MQAEKNSALKNREAFAEADPITTKHFNWGVLTF